jgi:hypothetical protein
MYVDEGLQASKQGQWSFVIQRRSVASELGVKVGQSLGATRVIRTESEGQEAKKMGWAL